MGVINFGGHLRSHHEPLLSGAWSAPVIPRDTLNLQRFIDRHTDVGLDRTLYVGAMFSDVWPNSSKPMRCGDGTTIVDENHKITVVLGCADVGTHMTPLQALAICIAWKHEMEHVRQYTDTCVHPKSTDARIITEIAATFQNPHFYRDNYGMLLFENQAVTAGFRDGPEMAKRLLKAYNLDFSDSEIACASTSLAEGIRDGNLKATENPFFNDPDFTDDYTVLDALTDCANEIRENPEILTASVFDIDASPFSFNGTTDAIGDYLLSPSVSQTFLSIVLGDAPHGVDILKCLAAYNYLRTPFVASLMPNLSPSMLIVTHDTTYDPVSEISRTRPAFMAMRFRNSIIRASNSYVNGSRQFDTDNLYLP